MKKTSRPELICKFLHIGKTTYYKYFKNDYSIIRFLQNFSNEELEELNSNAKLKKFDNLVKIEKIVIKNQSNKYINTFLAKTQSNSIKHAFFYFLDFYFSFLVNFQDAENDINFLVSINNFLFDYIDNNNNSKDDLERLKTISPYLVIFKDFDDLMIIFLKQSIKNDFAELIENGEILNELTREEVYLHVISLFIYKNYQNLSSNLKIEIIKNLHDKSRGQFFDHSTLIKYINENIETQIKIFKDLGLDTSLYS